MRRKTFTLIEMITVMVIVGVFAAGFAWFFTDIIDTWNFISFRNEMFNQVRMGILQMSRQIRQIKRSTASQDTIEIAEAQQLQFIRMNSEGDDIRIRYYLSGGSLIYELDNNFDGTFETSEVLIDGLDSFSFHYYDDNGNELSQPIDTHRILTIEVSFTINYRNQSYNLTTSILPRNLRG